MIVQDQREAIALLASPATFGGQPVERIDTHTAAVFLAGQLAYKLKRAVRYDYLDFSTPERRHRFCELELRLNRRTAPQLYRRVIPITRRTDGSLGLGGVGPAVEWVIEMARFPQEDLFDRLAAEGHVDVALIRQLADHIASFHTAAERRSDHGGRVGMQWVADGNAAGLAEFGGFLDAGARARLTAETNQEVARLGALLDTRRVHGFVRHCHGDLHLGNIVLLDGQPTLFDGIEFNDEIACVDVLYDLAFLLMDLWHRHLQPQANALLNRYLTLTDDIDGLPLLPLFLSCRAAIKAKTSATATQVQTSGDHVGELTEAARVYFALAETLLRAPAPCLVAIGGLSGAGKSTLAMNLAPSLGRVPGALLFRSDEIRKRLLNVGALDRLGPDGYSPAVTARVYQSLADLASRALRAEHPVIVDAVYRDVAERERIAQVAQSASVPFIGIWLDAPEPTLIVRVSGRQRDASDADANVVRMQLARGTGDILWHRIDASVAADAVADNARRYLP